MSRPTDSRLPPSGRGAFGVVLVFVGAVVVFAPVVSHPFLNWDDPQALVRNEALDAPGLLSWAFTTTHLSHFQPLSWLFWAGLRRVFGPGPGPVHAASLLGHALNAVLVFLLARACLRAAGAEAAESRLATSGWVALLAALLFALHPLRVEVVAWASAFPYILALAFLLASALLYLRGGESGRGRALSALAYGASLLSRPLALGYPLVLLALDLARGRPLRRALVGKLPFALLALAAGLMEAHARPFVDMEQVGLGPRLSAAAAAPLLYLGRAVVPLRLSPLDVLPLAPRTSLPALVAGAGLLALLLWAGARLRRTRPWLVAGAFAYLCLLAPAAGLAPSGLQATADRYTYFPDVALALLAGAGLSRLVARWRATLPLALVLVLALAVVARVQLGFWRDSVILWTRAAALDPRNDVALYNLALALQEAGDPAAAEARLKETLALVPDHEPARRLLATLEARRLEQEAGALAARGRLAEAIDLLGRVLEREPGRMRAHASRGMALAELGRFAEAATDLRAALDLGNDEPQVSGALALCLLETGRGDEAVEILEAAVTRHPEEPRLVATLAMARARALEKKSPGR